MLNHDPETLGIVETLQNVLLLYETRRVPVQRAVERGMYFVFTPSKKLKLSDHVCVCTHCIVMFKVV